MSLKYMQGFETVRDDSDLRGQGWTPTPATPTRKTTVAIPSVTGVNGFSLRPIGAFQTMSYSTSAWGSATDQTFGALNTGITLNQAWNAGGMTVGYGAQFNSGTAASFASGYVSTSSVAQIPNQFSAGGLQICFDGTRYWAIRSGGVPTTGVFYSTDLISWTQSPSQPTLISTSSSIQWVNNALVVVSNNSGPVIYYYSTNQGASWVAGSNLSPSFSNDGAVGVAFNTGNSTYPVGVSVCFYSNGIGIGAGAVFIGSLGGTFTRVYQGATNNTQLVIQGTTKTIGGNIFSLTYGSAPGALSMAPANSSSLNTATPWVIATLSQTCVDVVYNATSDLFIFATSVGIYTAPNSNGTPGNPAILPTSPTLTVRSSAGAIAFTNVFVVGSKVVAVGKQGKIAISSDGGLTWVDGSGHLLTNGVVGIDWRGGFYDGSKYILFSDPTTGIIGTSPDLQSNFQATYAMENAEISFSLGTGLAGAGVMLGTAPSASTGQWTPVVTTNGFPYLVVTPVSGGVRQYAFYNSSNTTTALASGTLPASTGFHYYEWKFTKVAGTTNMFNLAFYVDSVQIATISNYQMSTTSDTTSFMLLTFQRNGAFTAFDDIYVTLDDGTNTVGPLGQVNIFVRRPTTDVQAQWVKSGSAASNSLSVNQPAISSQSANSVTSNNPGDKDIYSSTDVVPAGYSVKAIQMEGYFSKTSTSTPQVSLGVVSGSQEVDSSAFSIGSSTPTYTSQIVEKDPNGNVAWTNAAVIASKPVINHIS